jgi:hypothetical protein
LTLTSRSVVTLSTILTLVRITTTLASTIRLRTYKKNVMKLDSTKIMA